MKITKEKEYKDLNNRVDYMSLIDELQEKFGTIYWDTIDDTTFVYRPLGRREYRDLLKAGITKFEEEDVLCQACVLYPEDYNFEECPAGIPSQLAALILKNSYLDSLESKKLAIAYYRQEMNNFDNQIDCIISEAFPYLDIEEIKKWDMGKTANYLAQAEWKLNILRNIPVDYELSDKLMEADWYLQHNMAKDNENTQSQQQKENKTTFSESTKKLKHETLEERQKRLAQTTPRKKTQEEIAEMKRRFPEINWEAEVDPSKGIDEMRDIVDTTSPALRVGY